MLTAFLELQKGDTRVRGEFDSPFSKIARVLVRLNQVAG
jgi:hypothetical protein